MRKIVNVYEDNPRHKMSYMGCSYIPCIQTYNAQLSQHFSLQFFTVQLPSLPPSQWGMETSIAELKIPALCFAVQRTYQPLQYHFPRLWPSGKQRSRKTTALQNAEGFHVAWPKPSRHGPREESSFPPPDVSNKGQRKTLPWWDEAIPLSSGNVNHRALPSTEGMLLFLHKSNPAEIKTFSRTRWVHMAQIIQVLTMRAAFCLRAEMG